MSWAMLLFLVPLVLFVVAARRLVRFMRLLRDPKRLQAILSEETRDALSRAGLDPGSVDMQALQNSPELSRLVGADMQRALRGALLVRAAPAHLTAPARTGIAPFPVGFRRADQPVLPPPIDAPSRAGLRLLVLLVFIALSAAAILALGSR